MGVVFLKTVNPYYGIFWKLVFPHVKYNVNLGSPYPNVLCVDSIHNQILLTNYIGFIEHISFVPTEGWSNYKDTLKILNSLVASVVRV